MVMPRNIRNNVIFTLAVFCAVFSLSGCKKQPDQLVAQPKDSVRQSQAETNTDIKSEQSATAAAGTEAVVEKGPDIGTTVLIKTSMGDITVGLYEDDAPITTKNFLSYVMSGFYNDTIIHRVVNDSIIQGGGLTSDMKEKAARIPIVNECYNKIRNKRGTIAMARKNDINSATSQFYINCADHMVLDFDGPLGGYAVFGQVVEGMDVVDKIAKVKTGIRKPFVEVPEETVAVKSIEVVK